MKNGFVKAWRCIKYASFYKSPLVSVLAQHLIREVNHTWGEVLIGGKLVKIAPGQILTSRETLSRETGLTSRNIRTAIKTLKNCQFLTSKATNKYTILTICKYYIYNTKKSQDDQQSDQQATSKRPASDQQSDHKQEIKNVKNKKNINIHAPENKEFLELAKLLKTKILENNPKAKITDSSFEGWVKDVRLMKEGDSRVLQEIRELIIWAQQDSFWYKNILSMDKLRKQFDQLTLQRKGGQSGSIQKTSSGIVMGKYS